MTQFSPGNTAGAASFDQEWYLGQLDIFYSQDPHPVTQDFQVDPTFLAAMKSAATTAGSNVAIPYGFVVGINSAGKIAAATYGSGGTPLPLLGVMGAPVMNDFMEDLDDVDPVGVDPFAGAPVFIQGYFDIDGLTFPAAFTDDAHKFAAARQTGGVRQGSVLLFGKKAYSGIIADPQPDL